MKLYRCPRCGHEAKQKNNLRRHFLRKNECPKTLQDISLEECFKMFFPCENFSVSQNGCIEEFCVSQNGFLVSQNVSRVSQNGLRVSQNGLRTDLEEKNVFSCEYCEKEFIHRQSKFKHMKKCKVKKMYLENVELKLENEKLKSQTKQIIGNNNNNNCTTNTNSHNNSHNNTQNNITINAFGKENLDYITKEFVQAIVNEGPYGSIQKLVKYLHFNPKHRENHNIKIPNKRDKFGMVYNGKDWVLQNKQNMINTITEHAFDIITEHCDDMSNRKYDKFCDEFENNVKTCINRVNADTELVILNEQTKINI